MARRLNIHDTRSHWGGELLEAARRREWEASIISKTHEIDDGYGFIRVHASPKVIGHDKRLGRDMARRLTMITDLTQIEVYDDKRAQYRLWKKWMPFTRVYDDREEALSFAESADYPLMSKADVGASSRNVRFLKNREEGVTHVAKLFDEGIMVDHCAGDGKKTLQKGYVILQRFIPHEVTYRVNAIGDQRAVFFRKCYADRPMAQTGNTDPAYKMSAELESLFDYANRFFKHAGTKWCALDILKDGKGWKLLETSLAWPHPSPGDCNNATFFPSGRKWIDMWDVLIDELEAGAWG